MKLIKESDLDLLDRLNGKDSNTLEHLVDPYSTLLYQVAIRITGDQAASEQILCEVFRELWDNPYSISASNDTFLSSFLIKRCKLKCVQKKEIHITSVLSKESKNYIASFRSI